ncbi:hypothetical protein GGH91_003431 [Coemansia sp. RSA 2671]|nr:hypothetical protein GGH91_003431 [Coemansia sp. RSA 2671]
MDGYFEPAPTASLQPQQRLPEEVLENQWTNAPQDPYENLLDEVDQLLGEIKDDDEPAAIAGLDDGDFDAGAARGKAELDLDLDDDSDDDLAHLLTDKP